MDGLVRVVLTGDVRKVKHVFISRPTRCRRLIAEQRLDILHRTTENGALATFDDRALHEFGMLDQERDDFVISQSALAQILFAIDGFVFAQQLARRDLHLGDERAQFLFAKRRGRIVDLLEFDAALTEQAVGLATGASSRFFVNRDLEVVHLRLSNSESKHRGLAQAGKQEPRNHTKQHESAGRFV